MKNSQFTLLLAAIWISPFVPDISNIICGGVMFVCSMYYLFKGD